MSDLNESYRDDGRDHNEVRPDLYGPDDDVTAAFGDGQYEDARLGPTGRDETAFARRPDEVVQAASHKLVDHELTTVGTADAAPQGIDSSPIVDIRPIAAPVRDIKADAAVESSKVDDVASEREFDLEAISWLGPEIVRQADTLLRMNEQLLNSPKHDGDDYLRDASGHVKQIVRLNTSRTASMSSGTRLSAIRRATVELTGYAVRIGNEPAARFGYDSLPQGDRWLMYAEAYETPGIDPKLIAEWRRGLDVTHEHAEEPEDTATQASRLFALTMGKVHDYTSIPDPVRLVALRERRGAPAEGDGTGPSLEVLAAAREEHKQMAVEYATRLNEVLGSIRRSHAKGSFAFLERTWQPDQFEARTTLGFARAGIWEGAAVLHKRHGDKHVQRLTQMIKAVHGQLGSVENQQLRFGGDNGRLLRWLNGAQHGNAGDPPKIDYQNVHNLQILEDLIPERLLQAGFQSSSESRALSVVLNAEDYESVRANYNAFIARPGYGNSSIQAALNVSQHLHEVQAAGAAHEVYEGAFLDELAPVEARVDEIFDSGNDDAFEGDIMQELSRLYEESGKLKDPVTSLHAKARLATMYLEAAPNDKRVEKLMTDIREQWDILERREGGEQEFMRTYKLLKSAGLDLEPQWKREGTDGFIGYRPSSMLLFRRDPSLHMPFRGYPYATVQIEYSVSIDTANRIIDTATALNQVLGTERYQVGIAPEDMEQVEALRSFNAMRVSLYDMFPHRYTKYPVELNGPWRRLFSTEVYGYNKEFEDAAGNLQSDWPLHQDTTRTDRLTRLVGQAEAEWQDERAD